MNNKLQAMEVFVQVVDAGSFTRAAETLQLPKATVSTLVQSLETALSAGYTVSQYLGWQWGKFVAPKDAARFHAVVLLSILAGMLFIESGVDPIKVTEYSIVLSPAALPLTYFPILVIANDPDYVGDKTNSWFSNVLGSIYLVITVVAALAAIPLMIITKAGS